MTELERLELVLRRVRDRLEKSPRFAVSDELIVLRMILDELTGENIKVAERDEKKRA